MSEDKADKAAVAFIALLGVSLLCVGLIAVAGAVFGMCAALLVAGGCACFFGLYLVWGAIGEARKK